MTEKILILDFGSQYTQLIARAVREADVYCEIIPFHQQIVYDDKPERYYSFRLTIFCKRKKCSRC